MNDNIHLLVWCNLNLLEYCTKFYSIQQNLCCPLFQMTVAAGTSIENNIQRTISCPNVCSKCLGFLHNLNVKPPYVTLIFCCPQKLVHLEVTSHYIFQGQWILYYKWGHSLSKFPNCCNFFLYGLMVQLNKDEDNIFIVPSAFTLLPSQLNAPVSWNQ